MGGPSSAAARGSSVALAVKGLLLEGAGLGGEAAARLALDDGGIQGPVHGLRDAVAGDLHERHAGRHAGAVPEAAGQRRLVAGVACSQEG